MLTVMQADETISPGAGSNKRPPSHGVLDLHSQMTSTMESEQQYSASMALLEKLYPTASQSELVEVKATLDRYFDIGLKVFAASGEELLYAERFDDSRKLSYDQDTKVEP